MEANLTIKEKQIIVSALELHYEAAKRARNIIADDKEELTKLMTDINELWEKFYLDLNPIEVKSNNLLMRTVCPLCGRNERPGTPEWAFVNGDALCFECFKKHEPEQYATIVISNDEKYREMYPDEQTANTEALPFL
jgi:hypothetical protein